MLKGINSPFTHCPLGLAADLTVSLFISLLFTNAKLYRPRDAEELFNLCHVSACNIIKHIFGVLKWRFHILVHPLQFDMDVQAHLPLALAAVHNFIQKYNSSDITDFNDVEDPQLGMCGEGLIAAEGQLAGGLPEVAERQQANERWGRIAQEMWAQYQAELSRCNLKE